MGDPFAEGGTTIANRDLGGGFSLGADGTVYYGGVPVNPAVYQEWQARQAAQDLAQQQTLRQTPTSSSSSSVSQSFQDPAALALQAQELQLRMVEAQRQAARDNVLDGFTRDRMALDERLGNAANTRADQALLEQINARQTNTQLSMAQLKYEYGVTQAQLNFSAAQANAQAQMQAEQINESRRTSNLEQRRGVAQDIATFARNPGDVGANAAYLLAGGAAPAGPSAISQSMATGQDARTPQALVPLDLLLSNRAELAKGPTLFQPTMVQAPQVAAPDFSNVNLFQQPNVPKPAPAATAGGGGYVTGYDPGQAGGGTYTGPSNAAIQAALNAFASEGAAANAAMTGMAGGGYTTDRMFKGNERGPELFFNPTGAPIMVMKHSDAKQMPGFADGTLDLQSLFYNDNGAQPDSLGFLNQATDIARAGGPFARGALPTPVGVSAPGTSPFVQEYAASLAALRYGVNPNLFLSEAQAATPVGLSGAPTRRTR